MHFQSWTSRNKFDVLVFLPVCVPGNRRASVHRFIVSLERNRKKLLLLLYMRAGTALEVQHEGSQQVRASCWGEPQDSSNWTKYSQPSKNGDTVRQWSTAVLWCNWKKFEHYTIRKYLKIKLILALFKWTIRAITLVGKDIKIYSQ